MAFRSKLARYGTINCEQVMPVPVIPICAISCCIPQPICEYKQPPPPPPPPPPQPPSQCNPSQAAVDCGVTEAPIVSSPIKIPNYNPSWPTPPTGTILTNTFNYIPEGYLAANGVEVSRTTYNALYMVIGSYYGAGDESTTFNLPNLECKEGSTTYIIKT
jgi:hypothetical protein